MNYHQILQIFADFTMKVIESNMVRSFADILFPTTTSSGFRLSPAKEPSPPTLSSACQTPRLEKHKKLALQKIEHIKTDKSLQEEEVADLSFHV